CHVVGWAAVRAAGRALVLAASDGVLVSGMTGQVTASPLTCGCAGGLTERGSRHLIIRGMAAEDGGRPRDPYAHRGRGARLDPLNRYTRLEVELDPEEVTDDDLRARTRYLDDTSRSAVAPNDSPDVGVDCSVTPCRGCEHGCSYCLGGNTSVLMADGSTTRLADGRVGERVLGTAGRGRHRRLVETEVLDEWAAYKP